MHLLTENGIQDVTELKPMKSIFCKHKNRIIGENCSSIGLVRISGRDTYEVCQDCGKVLKEIHTEY